MSRSGLKDFHGPFIWASFTDRTVHGSLSLPDKFRLLFCSYSATPCRYKFHNSLTNNFMLMLSINSAHLELPLAESFGEYRHCPADTPPSGGTAILESLFRWFNFSDTLQTIFIGRWNGPIKSLLAWLGGAMKTKLIDGPRDAESGFVWFDTWPESFTNSFGSKYFPMHRLNP